MDSAPSLNIPSLSRVTGWHFYAYLHLSEVLFDQNNSVTRLGNIYDNLSRAATAAIKCADAPVRVLEHQGQMLHFIVESGNTGKDINALKGFAVCLTAAVLEFVTDGNSREQGIGDLTMAAAFGESLVMIVPPLDDDSLISRVSLGECANEPAKKLLNEQSGTKGWNFYYKKDTESDWIEFPCEQDAAWVKAAKTFSTSIETIKEGVDHIVKFKHTTACHPNLEHGYVFRADLDDFKRHVRSAFDLDSRMGTTDHTEKLAWEFVQFMNAVTSWQKDGAGREFDFALSPWAGDCCTMVVFNPPKPRDLLRALHGDYSAYYGSMKEIPMSLMKSWDAFSSSQGRDGKFSKWSCSLAFGKIGVFNTRLDGIEFSMLAGKPLLDTNAGVNLEGTAPGDLVMLQSEVSLVNAELLRSFSKPMGMRFVAQPQEARRERRAR